MRSLVSGVLLGLLAFATGGTVGGYLMIQRTSNGKIVGLVELEASAEQAAQLPVNRIWIAFFSPQMVYKVGSNTLKGTGMDKADESASDRGFARMKAAITKLHNGGVEVFLSMGGWNFNCFPYLYMRYSVGGYGSKTPNFWSIQQFGNGDVKNCKETNQYCYVCEPMSARAGLSDYQIFPEPGKAPTFQQAQKWVESKASNTTAPSWNTDMVPGKPWKDKNASITVVVPGNGTYDTLGSDPYADFVMLAKDLGAAGIDLDYEEFWHADYFKTCETQFGSCDMKAGPWLMWQTVFKFAAIIKDFMINIDKNYPALKLSCPSGAASAWTGHWWGGNLKGLILDTYTQFPEAINFMTKGKNAGGINVMTYDLSNNPQFHECPGNGICSLDAQVEFYMNTYKLAGIPAAVGYEVGTPAYPNPAHDPTHQLPLTADILDKIVSKTQPKYKAGFFWEMYKPAGNMTTIEPTAVAQAICKVVLPEGTPRCKGVIPPAGPATPTPAPVPTPPTPVAPTPILPSPAPPTPDKPTPAPPAPPPPPGEWTKAIEYGCAAIPCCGTCKCTSHGQCKPESPGKEEVLMC
jgi:hypothetical protein